MHAKQLNDEVMDSIIGGSSYMSELSGFLQMSSAGIPCLKVSYGKSGSSTNMLAHMDCPLTEKGMAALIRVADRCGKVTLISPGGHRTDFSAEQLKAMM